MKYLRYLYILGLLIAIVGLVAGWVSQIWLPIPISLLVLGLVLIGIWLGIYSTKIREFWSKNSTETKTNGILTIIAFLLILGILNFLAVRYQIRVDFTENQVFTISSQSQQIVNNLNQPLKVWIFQSQINPRDLELLKNYSSYNSKFNYQLIDPDVSVQLAKEFGIKTRGEVYVEYNNQKRLVQVINEVEPLSEIKLTSAIEAIQRDNSLGIVYFLQGHGEAELNTTEGGLSEAVNSLKRKGYEIKTLNLAKIDKLPENIGVIVITSPKRKLLEGEVKTIKKYLDNNGNLLLMLDPKTDPGLTELLKEWGIELDQRIVIDVSGTATLIGFGPATVVITNYGKHPITEAFAEQISLYHLARPISTKIKENIEPVALLITNSQTWAESRLDGENVEFNENEDIKGPLDIGVALTRQNQDKGSSHLVIIGNASFATNGWLKQQLNEDMFLNTIEWLTQQQETLLSITPKEPENRRINLTVMQGNVLGWLALVFVPLLGFITAIITWWRRR